MKYSLITAGAASARCCSQYCLWIYVFSKHWEDVKQLHWPCGEKAKSF